jgi:Kef-type K+ transport system membrane component KefB
MLLLLCADLAIIVAPRGSSAGSSARSGQPPVVGEILAGVILGPSLLGTPLPGAIKTI